MRATKGLESQRIAVRVLTYDGTEYRRWNARVSRLEGSLIVLDAEFEYDVQHHLLGHIERGTRTIEYYWLDRWYNIFRFLKDDGSPRLWYCNINTPPTLDGDVLSYVDLDIDILVQPDFSYEVLDMDEFEKNSRRFEYSNETRKRVHLAVSELVSMIQARDFPFVPEPELSTT
jgi:uncharacterized protein